MFRLSSYSKTEVIFSSITGLCAEVPTLCPPANENWDQFVHGLSQEMTMETKTRTEMVLHNTHSGMQFEWMER